MKTLNLAYIIWKEGKYYVSQCLNVDVASCGDTRKQAFDNLQEALELYFDDNKTSTNLKPVQQPKIVKSSLKIKNA